MPDSDPLPELTRLAQGDERAWETGFRVLWPLACGAARRAAPLLSREEIEDAAAEALAQLPERIHEPAGWDELRALTVTIAYRRAISLVRAKVARKRAGQTVPLEDWTEECAAAEAVPGPFTEQLTGQELLDLSLLLTRVTACLDDETRALALEKFAENLSYQELARRHGLPQGTVTSKIARGLARVCRSLQASPELLKQLRGYSR